VSESGRDERERQVAGVWRRDGLTPGAAQCYLQWVRLFRADCRRRHLDEASELTQAGAIRFAARYRGRRKKGAVGATTRRMGRTALRAWAYALGGLGVSVPPWQPVAVQARLPSLLTAYAAYRRSHGGVAARTLQRDVETATTFLALLRRADRSPCSATVADLDRFVSDLTVSLGTRSVLDRCSSLRAFLRFLRVTGRAPTDLSTCVVAPRFRLSAQPPRALPWREVRRILRAIPRTQPPGKRDFAMMLMMATYGLGAAELLALRLEAIDWRAKVLHVRRPKTGAVVELPLLPPVARALAAYLRTERPRDGRLRSIFVSTHIPYEALTSGGLRHRVRDAARRAGITTAIIGAHVFRHSHATRQIDAGINPKVVGDILGHRRPSSTSVYVRVALRRLRMVALPVPR
jgi:integrase/recombinase XerD